jgi:hypothetical protein
MYDIYKEYQIQKKIHPTTTTTTTTTKNATK